MYKIMSSWYGQMSTKATLDDAIYCADSMKIKAHSDEHGIEIFFVWKDGVTLFTA